MAPSAGTAPRIPVSAVRLLHVAGTQWGAKRYLNMDLLREQDLDQALDLVEAS